MKGRVVILDETVGHNTNAMLPALLAALPQIVPAAEVLMLVFARNFRVIKNPALGAFFHEDDHVIEIGQQQFLDGVLSRSPGHVEGVVFVGELIADLDAFPLIVIPGNQRGGIRRKARPKRGEPRPPAAETHERTHSHQLAENAPVHCL